MLLHIIGYMVWIGNMAWACWVTRRPPHYLFKVLNLIATPLLSIPTIVMFLITLKRLADATYQTFQDIVPFVKFAYCDLGIYSIMAAAGTAKVVLDVIRNHRRN